jgi:hypothetical protein
LSIDYNDGDILAAVTLSIRLILVRLIRNRKRIIRRLFVDSGGSMNLSGVKRLSEPLLLKNILMEESGDTCELTIVIMTVHAVMLESGFVLFDPDSSMRFSFSKKTLVSLNYTLPSVKGIVGLNFEKEAML